MGIYFFLTQTTTFIFGSRTARTPFIAPYSLEVRMELPAFLPVVAPAAPPEGFGGRDPFTQADAGCPAGQVVRHHLYRQPGAVGGEAPRGHVVQPDAVLEVAYRILDLGVAAMISLQFQHLPIPIGDEAVIAVGGEEGELGTGRGLHPPPG